MNLHRPVGAKPLSDNARADIARIQQLWTDCRQQSAKVGPFLFGTFSAADAMYGPVVHRFRTYAIAVTPPVRAYMDAMMSLPALQQWTEQGLAETLVIEKLEAD
jgi:glutathione S-transferase